MACSNIFTSNWGSQSYARILLVSDLGVGLGPKSLKNFISGLAADNQPLPLPLQNLQSSVFNISIMCMGNSEEDLGFKYGQIIYQQLLDVLKQKGELFLPRLAENQSMERAVAKMFKAMCESNYKPFEAYLKIGSYMKLESSPISLFPEPLPYSEINVFGNETTRVISRHLEVCGYIKISDLVGSGGSPASLSRNLIFPRVEASQKKTGTELEKLESEMKHFFAKSSGHEDDDASSSSMPNTDLTTKESAIGKYLNSDEFINQT